MNAKVLRHIHIKYFGLILCTFFLLAHDIQAQSTSTYLSQVAVFARCYAHLTQQRPKITDPLFLEVKTGKRTALDACEVVLDTAKFIGAGNTRIANVDSEVSKNVLYTMHQLHRSWARERRLAERLIDVNGYRSLRAWYEDSPMGAFITRALFMPGKNIDSIISGTDFLQEVRKTPNTAKSYDGIPNASNKWRLAEKQPFAPRDDLLGIQTVTIPPVSMLEPVKLNGNVFDLANMYVSPAATKMPQDINYADVATLSEPIKPTTTLFAVRFTGKLNVLKAGSYKFWLDVDDVATLVIDGQRVDGSSAGTPFPLSLGLHTLDLQYFQNGNKAKVVLSWEGPNIAKQAIPAINFLGLKAEYYTHRGFPAINFTGSQGGGFIGNHNYLLTTFNPPVQNFVPNGQIGTDRSYPRAVLHDTLCRDVPAARESDVESFVDENSETPFRNQASCTVCHATLDRLAGATVRNMRWAQIPNSTEVLSGAYILHIGALGLEFINPSFKADSSWPATLDIDYARRAPSGHLFFRNYKGELINVPITSFANLASAISKQDDYYICFAKRYYKYFMGIDVVWGDPGDPAYPELTKSEEYHLNTVIKLGLDLKQHKSLRELILNIIKSDEYRMSDYGINYGGPG